MDIKSLEEINTLFNAEFKKAMKENEIEKMQVITDLKEKTFKLLELPF